MTKNSFQQMIKGGVIKRSDTGMKIRFADLHVKEGFNKRTPGERLDQSIVELFQFIKGGGKVPALEVVPREGGGVEIVEGHRRQLSFGMAIDEGLPIEWIDIVPFTGNDADRVARIVTSNSQLPLLPLEAALVYKQLAAFGLSIDEVAAKVNKTRQHVEQMLTLANANTDVQKMVAAGTVAAATAVELVREHGEGAGKVLAAELDKAKAAGKAKVTAGTIKGATVPRGLLDDMHSIATKMHKSFKPDDLLAIERYHRGEITEGTVEVSLEVAMQFHLMLEEGARVLADKEAKQREKADKAKQMELDSQ